MHPKIAAVASSRPISIDVGLLLLRVGIGLSMFLFHGLGKLTGGPETWAKVGGAMGQFGIDFAPEFWGFMAAVSESACALLLVVGLLTRPAAVLMACTMFVAAATHLGRPEGAPGAGWSGASHAIEFLVVSACLFFTGPGRFSLGALLDKKRTSAAGTD